MIFRIRELMPRLRRTARQLWRSATPAQGRHRADSASGLDWHERTARPPALPARLSAPRIVPQRLSLTERVKLAYDYAEDEMTARIYAAVCQSGLSWAQSHA